MAHFAELGSNNVVLRVVVVGNEDCLDESGIESEAAGIAFLHRLFGGDRAWAQTSYNSSFRGVYAGIGYTYDPAVNAFIAPAQPEDIAESLPED